MNWNYRSLVPDDFAANSRVWIYQSNRVFSLQEALELEKYLYEFVDSWQSHGIPVKGYGNLFFGQFIVLMADETATGVSGCSTDSSVRFIKKMEELFNVQLFNRQLLAFVIKDKVQVLPLSQLKYALENNYISGETLYFNNVVQTKEELLQQWLIPVKDSWLRTRITQNV